MAEQSLSERIGATPGKSAVAVILLGVFVSQLIMQLGDEQTNEGSLEAAKLPELSGTRSGSLVAQSKENLETTPSTVNRSRPWPEISLAEVRKYNPFFMPGEAGTAGEGSSESRLADAMKQKDLQERAEMRKRALATLREKGVGVVLKSDDELVAIIGSDTVRIGDVISGFKVVSIGPDGVMLKPDEPE